MLLFGGVPYAIVALFTAFLTQFAFFSIALWLSQWTGAYSKSETVDIGYYLGIYACILLGFNLMVPINNLVFQYGNWKAARSLHARLTDAVLNSPIRWFDYQPIGTILNRFSQDIQSLDSVLLNWLRMTLDNQLRLLFRVGGIASILPIFALPAAVFCSIGFAVGEIYTRAQISIKRLTSATRSPIFAHFSETLVGLPTIRAQRGMKEVFGLMLADHLRNNSRAYEALYNSNRWVSVRADAVAASVSAAAGIIAVMKSDTISAGLVGFSLTNAIGLSQTILTMVRNMNELEVELNSFQRVLEFTQLPSEEDNIKRSTPPTSPPASWPSRGEIEFSNFSASYGESGPNVIKDLSLRIRPGERIGVVGRTGSGKSTLALSLLRFTHETNGSVFIDGVDTSSMSLKDLRRAVTIIPQDSTLFAGDLRSNLDPFNEIEDTELNHVLRACSFLGNAANHQPKNTTEISQEELLEMDTSSSPSSSHHFEDYDMRQSPALSLSLSTPVAINGSNFSRGERQALCLTRAVCRRSKIVIVDEATSSVDNRTDAMIQNVLRTEFAGSTVLTIAHRLKTIIDYDRILVLSAGRIVELDTPRNLLDQRGVFWSMVRESGEIDELLHLGG
jgi:ABC-type multidrug transport system fused ATPase/permease subunit